MILAGKLMGGGEGRYVKCQPTHFRLMRNCIIEIFDWSMLSSPTLFD